MDRDFIVVLNIRVVSKNAHTDSVLVMNVVLVRYCV